MNMYEQFLKREQAMIDNAKAKLLEHGFKLSVMTFQSDLVFALSHEEEYLIAYKHTDGCYTASSLNFIMHADDEDALTSNKFKLPSLKGLLL